MPDDLRSVWADRFDQQALVCAELGSDLYGRLLPLIAMDIRTGGRSWEVMEQRSNLRFGQAGPLRMVGAAHRLALSGRAESWATALPSCGGVVPSTDGELEALWSDLLSDHISEIVQGLDRELQTNEVGRSSGLSLAQLAADMPAARIIELGSAGGLNLHLNRFRIDLGGTLFGDPAGVVHLRPDLRSPLESKGELPVPTELIGIDPHPVDASTPEGALTLLCFLWPDQAERIARTRAVLEIARENPVHLVRAADTAESLAAELGSPASGEPESGEPVSTIIQHSITWQYIPTEQRWRITEAIEEAASRATPDQPLAWIRYEPDEWDRGRAAIRVRRWPDGRDVLVAHADYHGRWLEPVPYT